MLPIPDILDQVKARLNIGSLTPREEAFLNNLVTRCAQGRPLTPRQAEWLGDLLERAPSKPIITKYPAKETVK